MVRIELGDNDFALVYPEMIHKTTKELQKLVVRSIGFEGYQTLQSQLQLAKTEDEKKEILRKIPVEGEDDVTLLNQVSEWSFGTVTQEVIDHIPEVKYELLLMEVRKLISQVPLAGMTSLPKLA